MSGPVPRPAALPPGWQARSRLDNRTGEPIVLLRIKPYRRRVLAFFGIAGSAALWLWFAKLYQLDDMGTDRPFVWFMAFLAAGATVATLHVLAWQDGWAVAPGRLYGGRIVVTTGHWRGKLTEFAELGFRADENDGSIYLCLDGYTAAGERTQIYRDLNEDGRIARPFAGWLAETAGLPIRPAVDGH